MNTTAREFDKLQNESTRGARQSCSTWITTNCMITISDRARCEDFCDLAIYMPMPLNWVRSQHRAMNGKERILQSKLHGINTSRAQVVANPLRAKRGLIKSRARAISCDSPMKAMPPPTSFPNSAWTRLSPSPSPNVPPKRFRIVPSPDHHEGRDDGACDPPRT